MSELREAAQPESDPPRDEWRPASEPPDSERLVIVWGRDAPESDPWFDAWWYIPGDGFVTGSGDLITHWRDIEPPTDVQAMRVTLVPMCGWCGANPEAPAHTCPRTEAIAPGADRCNCCASCVERCKGYF